MKYLNLLFSTLCLAGWIAFGSIPGPGGLPLPALGKFFHPTEGFWANTRPVDRHGDRRWELGHPLATGTIFFDDRGVPHIFAPDLEAACFLQGVAHAADRLWQMDISTRATEGRLSEILGARTQVRDRDQIRRGFRQAARNETDTLRLQFPEEYRYLEAYAAGVNAWIDQLAPADYPVEYKLLGHAPLRWSPYRSALLMKGMSQSLSGGYADARAARTRDALGADVFRELYPARDPDNSPVVPDEGRYPAKGRPVRPADPVTSLAPARRGPVELAARQTNAPASAQRPAGATGAGHPLYPYHPDNGSNNWAVSGSRSNTGKPLLASDPHLRLTLPSIWSEMQIRYPGVNARGVSLPGAPGIMIGFNDYVAYGETNVGHDVTDWFAIDWTDTTRTHYRLDGETVAATRITDTIWIKGEEPEVILTPWTVFGPVPYTDGPYADHAMRYLAHDTPGKALRPHSTVGTFLGLMSAKDYADYNQALRGYVDPAQNFLFAARDGDIAIRPNGFFPLRGAGSGRFPLSGDRRANNWQGYVPSAGRPVHYNPGRGYVSSANQVTTGPDYPYPYFSSNFDKYRGRYINRRLERAGTMNQRNMKELQLDSYSLLAEELAPLLIARINRSNLSAEGRRLLLLLSEWDYRYEGESRAASLFERWRRQVYDLTWDEVPRDSGYLRPEVWHWNDLIREQPGHPAFDIVRTENFRETAATLTQRAFDELLEELDGSLPEPWYELRASRVSHLGAVPGFGSALIRTGGARYTPRVLSGGHGASWRMVVELGDKPRAWGTLPGGASGDPASPYYDNGLDDWEQGRYHELTRWRDTNEARQQAAGAWRFGE